MIEIVEQDKCCGCSACYSICPKKCISMQADGFGFLHPIINQSSCIDCNRCRKVCPAIESYSEREPEKVYAAYNKDESIRTKSSSGGIFSTLAEKVISDGGVVFGAKFVDDKHVVHDFADSIEGLSEFRGSKYVQSIPGNSFAKVKSFLNEGRQVLYSGTSCQIAGLKKYLNKEYENLLTVEVICHGVPSPMVWERYLDSVDGAINEISFRDKSSGWKKYSVKIGNVSQIFSENSYMKVFLSNLCLRPSCFQCPVKAGKSGSDIILGDFWGIDKISPTFDDDRGCSLVMVNSSKGGRMMEALDIEKELHNYKEAITGNPSIINSVIKPAYYGLFMSICKRKGFANAFNAVFSKSLFKRLKRRFWLIIRIQ